MIYGIGIGQVNGYPQSLVDHGKVIEQFATCPSCKHKVRVDAITKTLFALDGSLWPDFLCLFPAFVVSEKVVNAWKSRNLLGYSTLKTNVKVLRRGEQITQKTLEGESFQIEGETTKLPAPSLQYYQVQINTVACPNPLQTLVSTDENGKQLLSDVTGACQRCGLLNDGNRRTFPETVRLSSDGLAGMDFAIWVGRYFVSSKVIEIAIAEKHTNLRWWDCNQDLSWSETTAFMNKMRKAFKNPTV